MNFLIIRYSSLGDIILTTPVPKNIKSADKKNRVDFLTKPEYRQVYFNNPHIDKIFTGVSRKIKYDYIIDLHNSLRSNIVKYFFKGNNRITYDKASVARRTYLHTGRRFEKLDKTVVDRYIEPLNSLNIPVKYKKPEIYLSDEEKEKVEKLTGKEKYVAIAPGAKWPTKEWIPEHYSKLIIKIIRDTGFKVVLLGTENQKSLIEKLREGTGLLKKHVKDLTGKTNIRTLAGVIDRARVLITTDSAPLHMGWALDTDTVALFGPTVKEFGFQPRNAENIVIMEKDMDCRPCSLHGSKKCKFKDHACMRRIEPQAVMKKLKNFL
ncbi:MAG: glycosyltransferase family 9 protein [Elusimicrobiota bacterium]